jgi:tRNA G18 (ribose-2'-O)-methylase SpoU
VKKSTSELERINIEEFKATEKLPIRVALDNIRSFNNVGSVFRTSDAFLVEEIILGGITPCPPHRDIHKTALGAELSMQWRHEDDLLSFLKSEKAKGVKIISLEQCHNSIAMENLWPQLNNNSFILVFGNEVKGVSEEIIGLSDYNVEIPQYGTKHSLNVSVSGGICLHDYARHRKNQ